MVTAEPERLDLSRSRWDLTTFGGRYQHFLNITDPRLSLVADKYYVDARTLVLQYMRGKEPPGTNHDQLWRAQKLYMSAYHPDSGEKQNRMGRMSFQGPAYAVIACAYLQFYKSLPAIMFWQWVNQSFNALVNYTNRNATSPITNKQIGIAYVTATTGAILAAFGFSIATKKSPSLIRRYLPLFSVFAAHMVNVPMSRQDEIIHGVKVYDTRGQELGTSHYAAYKGISQVVITRIFQTIPSLGGIPIIMEILLRQRWFRRSRWAHTPLQVLLIGTVSTLMVPVACALFPQKALFGRSSTTNSTNKILCCNFVSISISHLEPVLRNKIHEQFGDNVNTVYFNKGL